MADEKITEQQFRVVRNGEEQYSIWPAEKEIPAGWFDAGPTAGKEECLEYIKEVWPDITPRSVREAMRARQGNA